ncbi:MAG TPA: SRPBCC family protein, partial [Minicystis sp.]|nr:SRPBCC family protein [Minicystis sp.]
MVRPVVHALRVRCRASRLELWPYVADTELLNQVAGSARIEVLPASEPKGAARFAMTTRMGGVTVAYDEEPFSFAVGRSFSWTRASARGPTKRITGRYELADLDGGTEVTATFTTEPRSFVFKPIVWLVQGARARGVARYIRLVDDALVARRPVRLVA